MGSMLYGRGIFINRCYDELNVISQPDLVRAVHTEYLQAGAVVIETNTFGANAVQIGAATASKVAYARPEHGRSAAGAGVRGTRCARSRPAKAFVAGAIGPLGVRLRPSGGKDAKVTEDEAYAAFADQVKALSRWRPRCGSRPAHPRDALPA